MRPTLHRLCQSRPRPVVFTILLTSLAHSIADEIEAREEVPEKASEKTISATAALEKLETAEDLIRFENGDVIHGKFAGFADEESRLIWKRADLENPIRFQLDNVSQIILNEARNLGLGEKSSYLTLVNGDRIPGEIISLTASELTINSPVVGDLKIPRKHVQSLTPNPFDGELHYAGPYNSEGWMILGERTVEKEATREKILGENDRKALKKTSPAQGAEKETEEKAVPGWIHSGATFYNTKRSPLAFDANLPETGRLRFRAAWKGNLALTVAFHSDLTRPIKAAKKDKVKLKELPADAGEDEGNKDPQENQDEAEPPAPLEQEKLSDLRQKGALQTIPWLTPGQSTYADYFGTGYTLSISSYPRLGRNSFREDGTPHHENLRISRSLTRFPRDGEAEIEIRFDRESARVFLFVDGRYTAQWHDIKGYLGNGSGIGFYCSNTSTKIRISDIVVSSWSGNIDSARSMEHSKRDIVTLTNGTDRYSGEISKIQNNLVSLKSAYSEVQIPLDELSRIEFQRDGLTDPEDEQYLPGEHSATVIFKPYGSIELDPAKSSPTVLRGNSPLLGEIEVDLTSASLIRFIELAPDLSDWFKDL